MPKLISLAHKKKDIQILPSLQTKRDGRQGVIKLAERFYRQILLIFVK